jgi:hypothetical protein
MNKAEYLRQIDQLIERKYAIAGPRRPMRVPAFRVIRAFFVRMFIAV